MGKEKHCNCKKELEEKECKCNDKCTCGENCNCTEDNKCSEDCRCWENKDGKCVCKNCGCEKDKCKCGDNCNCKDDNKSSTSKETEYLELAQRIKAEFENYKRRNSEVVTTSFNNGVATAVTKMLPMIDSFNQAKSNIQDESVLSGIDMIYNQLIAGLKELNVEKIDCLGKVFDPNLHNAVLIGKDEAYPNETILEEYQAGFKMNDRVIRYSTVKVNKLD
ncbi:MAG: nucleotide exchange factor GrpE [Clostridia bacterium]|nr:nucleotide exchange factor GrpE [Clostridia bacterium]